MQYKGYLAPHMVKIRSLRRKGLRPGAIATILFHDGVRSYNPGTAKYHINAMVQTMYYIFKKKKK